MGLLGSQLQLAQDNKLRSDLEYKIRLIYSTKQYLSSQITSMVTLKSDMEPDSPEAKELEKKKENLQQADAALDQQLEEYKAQLEHINAREQSLKQEIQSSIQRHYAA